MRGVIEHIRQKARDRAAARRFRRIAQLENRRLVLLEKKYSKLIAVALSKQAESYITAGEISNDMFPIIEELYRSQFEYWLPYQFDQLESDGEKSDSGNGTGRLKRSRFFIDRWNRWIINYTLTELVTKVKAIDDVTRERIRSVVAGGAARGLEHEVIGEMVRAAFSPSESIKRGMTIARTEVAGAVNAAKERSSQDWQEETGTNLGKLWIHRGANKPREWHQALDTGVAIPKEVDFYVFNPETGNGEYMSRPHSAGASAENVINCGCQVIYTRWREE